MQISELLQILFYFTGIISLMLGIYSVYINFTAKTNRIFLAVCISLSIWALGFSMAINASTLENCLFWRRVSAVGWGSMFSLLLHFCLVLSEKSKLLKKWFFYLLLYTPAVITIYIFAISNTMAPNQYNLVRTPVGWTNIAYNNIWDSFFYVYYISYMIIGLMIVAIYGKKSVLNNVKKQVKLLLYSFFMALLMGSISDIISSSMDLVEIPQIAPIIMLIPLITICYSMGRYGFMNLKNVSESETILTKHTRKRVYENLSTALIIGGLVSYIVQYIFYEDFYTPIISSLFVFILGVMIRVIREMKVNNNAKDIFLLILIFVAIPSIILIFIDFGGVTVWSASFLFIMIAIVFNSSIVLISISTSVITTQILIWILRPEVNLVLDKVDYSGRIGILIVTIYLAYSVNKVFIDRLKMNADQLNMQRFISEVSSDFINVNQANINKKINWVLKIVGKLLEIDTINILWIDSENNIVEDGKVSELKNINTEHKFKYHFKSSDISWLMNKLIRNELLLISNVESQLECVTELREWLKKDNVHSFAAIPLMEKTNSMMILQFLSRDLKKVWTEEELRILNIIANIFSDALMKVEAEKEIRFMAYYDHLTGLPSRRLLRYRINQAIEVSKRTGKLIGVVFIDLDSFKAINDTLGHEGGDKLLKIISEKLEKIVGQSDTVSRFGGDEFVIVFNNISHENDMKMIIEKIMDMLKQTVIVEEHKFNLTASVGVAISPYDGSDMDSLIKNADMAMYKAKESGKNQYIICTTEMKNEAISKIQLTNSLYHALERNEFYLHYQPQISLETGKVIGVEALIRWNHPELGFVSPATFIPIAEQIGIINEIGEWVLKEACIQNRKWQENGYPPICMAVNVSVNQLRNISFADQIRQILIETGLEPKYLEVEITESTAMSESSDIVKLMNDLRKLGVIISIDDFGTHYSSLSRLKELPIDKIKIDKKFVDGIDEDDKDKAIVRIIIDLAKNLELKVIAEGVEYENQMLFLKQEKCDEIQGYYYYKPMVAQEIEIILKQYN